MFDHIYSHDFSALNTSDPAAPIRIFVDSHRDSLINAATLLAGKRGAKLTLELVDDLADGVVISRRAQRKLHELLEILVLEHVHDADREESGHFALLDPGSSVVEEICLLTDGFRDALSQAQIDHPSASHAAAG